MDGNQDQSQLKCTRCKCSIDEHDHFEYGNDPLCEYCYDAIQEMLQEMRRDYYETYPPEESQSDESD
jgi:predicted secreted protein